MNPYGVLLFSGFAFSTNIIPLSGIYESRRDSIFIEIILTTALEHRRCSIFCREFIKAEKIHKDFSKLYSDLFDWRNKGDYSDFIDFSEQDVLPLPDKAGKFIDAIEKIIK